MCKVSVAFGRLREKLWNNNDVTIRVKCQVYRAIVLTTLLYSSKSWMLYTSQVRKLNSFMMKQLKSIMKFKWWQKISSTKILQRAKLTPIYNQVIICNFKWVGHIARMDEHRLPKQTLFFQLVSGHKKRGRPKLRYKDTIQRNLKEKSIEVKNWYNLAQNRALWRRLIHPQS